MTWLCAPCACSCSFSPSQASLAMDLATLTWGRTSPTLPCCTAALLNHSATLHETPSLFHSACHLPTTAPAPPGARALSRQRRLSSQSRGDGATRLYFTTRPGGRAVWTR